MGAINLDEVFDSIIKGESSRYTKLTVGNKTEISPSYFKYMKEMYFKEWDGLMNPNNIFIPYILVSIEAVLRKLVVIDKSKTKRQLTATNILERVLSKDSSLVQVESNQRYLFGERIDGSNRYTIVGTAPISMEEAEIKEYILENNLITENKLVIEKHDKNGYIIRLKSILQDIQKNYYSENEKYGGLVYRNITMHANRLLLLENDTLFEEMLRDYDRLINSIWGDAIMPYEKDSEKNLWML